MEVWTIQDEHVWESLERDGVYRTPTKLSFPFLGEEEGPDRHIWICYKWMANELRRKTGTCAPAGTDFPVWGWVKQWGSDKAKPDMRSWTTQEPEKVVRLRLEIPDDRLLISSFDLWHMPLNCGFLSFTKTGDEQFDMWCESVGIDRFQRDIWDFSKQTHVLHKARRMIFESWKGIFPPFPDTYDEDWVGRLEDDALQAVFWEMRKEDVVSCEHFTTRRAWRPQEA